MLDAALAALVDLESLLRQRLQQPADVPPCDVEGVGGSLQRDRIAAVEHLPETVDRGITHGGEGVRLGRRRSPNTDGRQTKRADHVPADPMPGAATAAIKFG